MNAAALLTTIRHKLITRRAMSDKRANVSHSEYSLSKVLVVSKTTRYELEQELQPELSEHQVQALLIERGSQSFLRFHDEHKRFESQVLDTLRQLDVQVKLIDRLQDSRKQVDWADTIISVGGDGTFLKAADKVHDQSKPVIGLNSCPEQSIGYLCLPKMCSKDLYKTLRSIKERKFRWMYRTRIRITLHGRNIDKAATPLHGQFRSDTCVSACNDIFFSDANEETDSYTIPHLALNEVFISEKMPASVSYLDISVDDGEMVKTKNSGICVSTGSGSTSWHYTMNRITPQLALKLFDIHGGQRPRDIDALVCTFNDSLKFAHDDDRLCYTLRDLIPTSSWPKMPDLAASDFAKRILIKSNCYNGGLVIDCGCLYNFNAGHSAYLETRPEDKLKTIQLEQYNSSN